MIFLHNFGTALVTRPDYSRTHPNRYHLFNLFVMEMPEKSMELEDSNKDLTLNENQQPAEEETKNTVTADETPATDDCSEPEDAPQPGYVAPKSKEEALSRIKEIADREADSISREEVSRLKQQYFLLQKAAADEAFKKFTEEGGDPFAYTQVTDDTEEDLKELLNTIKEKKAARAAQVEAEHQRNYELKESLISELAAMASDTDNVNRLFPRFREIQQEFKTIGDVPPQSASDQWKKYQDAVEHFYDQLKVNKDLRDYDFKKNLDTKLHLCDEAEQLASENDVITAFKRLQDLHVKWRETGPVAKDIREEIWNRFKDASAVINKRYQSFFEERKQREQENEAAKTAICERVEAIDLESLKSFNAWNETTKTILQAQEDWKKLGFASKKANNALFARFRQTCDRFFTLKAEYYKSVKDEQAANLTKKTALCEQAEALKDSTEWKATADKLVELQKQWKKIGAVTKKHSDSIWKRFQTACDYFFEQKKKDFSDSRHAEQANLKAKRALTAALKEIPSDAKREDVIAAIKDAQNKWGEIGHVPFREKDKVYDEFRAAINELYSVHDLKETRAGFARFETTINETTDSNKLQRERERLARVLEQKRVELTTYQNNLGFFNFKSASGSSMLRDIERKTQRIKDDIADLEKKIELIDSRL